MIQKFKILLENIKFSHSIFALPYALASLFIATNGHPPVKIVLLVICAMVMARSSAMAFNRWSDADIDTKNPRTATRPVPQGLISKQATLFFTIVTAIFFIGTTFFINSLSFYLSPVALCIIYFYSFTKRFTHFAQIFLGLALGIAPIAAGIAATGQILPFSLWLGCGVLFWVAGFDIIYATQDAVFDQAQGLKSLVVKLGIKKALNVARLFHFFTVICFMASGVFASLGSIYFITIGVIALAFGIEHKMVHANDLSRVNAAFFTVNGLVGIFFLAGTLLDLYWGA